MNTELAQPTIKPATPDSATLARRLRRGIYTYVDTDLYKRCPRCVEYWPADSEFFYTAPSEMDGLMTWCKACYNEWRYPNGRKKPGIKPQPAEMATA